MKTSKLFPTDRPSRIYCAVCEKYLLDFTVNGTNFKPKDLSKTIHYECGSPGSMVYVFDNKAKAIPNPPNFPHCGDPKCEGYCDDLACIPISKQRSERSFTKENVSVAAIIIFIAFAVMYRLSS